MQGHCIDAEEGVKEDQKANSAGIRTEGLDCTYSLLCTSRVAVLTAQGRFLPFLQ